jgi:hypothetical protein
VGAGNLDAGQLAQVAFSGYPTGAAITASGELVPSSGAVGATFYSKSSSAPETESNWNTARDGSGMNAVTGDFTRGNIFVVQNGHTMTTAIAFGISGTGSKLQIESGGILETPSPITLNAVTTFQIDDGGTYKHQNGSAYGTTIFAGIESFGASSTIELNNSNSTGPSGINFSNLIINFTSTPSGSVNCSGGLTTINGDLTIQNTSTVEFRLTGGTTFTLNIGGNLNVTGGTFNLSSGAGIATINVGGNFTHTGGTITESSTGSGIIVFNGTGNQTIESIGQSNNITFTVAPTGSGTVEVAAGKTFVHGGATTFNVSNTSSATEFTVNGTFTRTSSVGATATGSMVVSATGTYISNFSGASIPTATWDAASLLQIDATIANGEFTESFGNVIFNNAAGCIMNTTASTYTDTIQGKLTLAGTGTVSLSNVGNFASTLTINGDLEISGNSTLVIDAGTTSGTITAKIVVSGDYIQSNGTLNLANNTSNTVSPSSRTAELDIYGNFNQSAGTITETATDIDMITRINLIGTVSKTFRSTGQTGQVEIVMNKTGGSGITLSNDAQIDYNLTQTSGLFGLGDYNLTLGTTATITGTPAATKMIVATGLGELRKRFTAIGTFTFPVGDNDGTAEYSPVTVNVTSGSFSSAYVGINLADAKHTNNNSTTNYLTRYWNVTQSGITGCVATITGTYINAAADVTGTLASIKAAQLDGTFNQTTNPWIKTGGSVLSGTTLTYTGATITEGQTSIFTGISDVTPTVSISPTPSVTVCLGAATPTLTANTTGEGTLSYLWSNSGGTSSTTDPSTATPGTTSYNVTVTDANGFTASSITPTSIIVNATSGGGTATATATTICYNGSTSITLADQTGSIQWQESANGSSGWANVTSGSGATTATYTTPNLTATNYYRAVVTSGVCAADNSSTASVTVRTVYAPGSINTTGETICYNGDPVSIGNNTLATGGDASYTYKWESSTDGFATSGSVIGGATSSSFDPPSGLTETTSYRRYAHDGTCNTSFEVSTGTWLVTVNIAPTAPTSISGTNTICGGAKVTLTAAGGTEGDGAVYEWGTGAVVGTSTIGGATSTSYTTPALNSNTTYWVRRTGNTACTANTSGTSQLVTVNSPSNVAGLATGDYVWAGYSNINWNTLENWLVYNSATTPVYSVATSVPSLTDKVFIINDDIACGFSSTASVSTTSASCNKISIDAGRTLTLADGETLNVSGNWTNSGTFTTGTGIVVFNGSLQQIIDAGASNFSNVTITNSAGVSLSSNLTISNTLTMNGGNIVTNGNTLQIGTDATHIGSLSYTSGTVLGIVKRWFAENTNSGNSGLFPVGLGANYRPFLVEFTQAPVGGGSLTVQFKNVAMGWQNGGNSPTIAALNGCEEFLVTSYCEEGYWEVTPSGAGMSTANYNVTLTATGIPGVNTLCKTTAMKRVGAGAWLVSGSHVAPTGNTGAPVVKRVGAIGWSNWGIAGGGDNQLPVELLSFTLNCDNNGVKLTWQTASEINNDYFVIEASIDGINFEKVGKITGAGNSNSVNNYSFDYLNNIKSSVIYYRLKQVDFDGNTKVLGIKVSNCTSESVLVNVLPNPFKESITIQVNQPELYSVEVYNTTGKKIFATKVTIDGQTDLNLDFLVPGMYMIRVIENKGEVHSFKVVKN